jgi:DNA-binding NarL/FixJ family response regulator
MKRSFAPRIPVVVVDDDIDTLSLVADILAETTVFECVGTFSDPAQALITAPTLQPRVALLDIRMPGLDGICLGRQLKTTMTQLTIVLMTGLMSDATLSAAAADDAGGYLVKPFSAEQCIAALKFAAERGCRCAMSPSSKEPNCCEKEAERFPARLSARESELMGWFAKGLLYKEAAEKLGTTYAVVHKLQHRIYVKLGVTNRTEALAKWRREPGF